MLKNFIRLYIILAIVTFLFIFNAESIIEFVFKDTISRAEKKMLRGPFYLIKQEVNQKPESEWSGIIKELQSNFGYPISIKKITDTSLTREEQKILLKEKYITTDFDHALVWHSLLKDNNSVISIEMSESQAEENHRSAKGIFYLLSKYLRSQPRQDWQNQINILQQEFDFPLKLLLIDELDLDEALLLKLKNDKAIGNNINGRNESFFMKIKDTNIVMKAGPFSSMSSKDDIIMNYMNYIALLIFASIIAVSLYIWMRPIWRDLSKLDGVATKFGQGEFQSRINLPKRSAIWHLSNTFDNMAERINKLINSHKELTNAVSHELRTPISRLRFAIEMLNDAKDENTRQRFINSMNVDIDELELLVSELLSYARFDRENPKLEFTRLDMSIWLPNIINKIKTENNFKTLQFITSNIQQPVIMDIDQKLFERALNNLIRNAVRYASSKVEVSMECKEHKCSVFIVDDGPGIPEKDRERILEPFTRLDTSRNRKSGGYGLGLSIVEQIIKWHNGTISISTSAYAGASFSIILPFFPDKQPFESDSV